MFSRSLRITVLASTPLLVVALGCDSRPSVEGSTTEATVRGTVRINGKPANGGEVVFDPSNYKRKNEVARSTQIQDDGTYEITTLVGPNMVRVVSEEAARASASYETIDFDVQRGENTFDISIPRQN